MFPTLTHDPWLSMQLGKPCYQLLHENSMTAELERDLSRVLQEKSFVTAKVPSTFLNFIGQLERLGFRLADTTVTLETDKLAHRPSSTVSVREANGNDRRRVEDIARSSFDFTRFHLDTRIERTVANELKAQWAANFFRGQRGDFMIVAERDGVVCGFCQLLLQDNAKTLAIDLIAVDEYHRGTGAATALINFYPATLRPLRRRASTQIANIPSLRLYEKAGYRTARSAYVLHAHGFQC